MKNGQVHHCVVSDSCLENKKGECLYWMYSSLKKENGMILPAVLKMFLCFEQILGKMFLAKHPSLDI